MATKKCPKCGEENPAEAVMCWACYTPLAGGAAAVAGGGLVTPRGGAAAVTPAATAAAGDNEKAPVDPKIFVVVGLLLVAAVIGSFTTGLIGGKSPDNSLPNVTQVTTGGSESEFPAPVQQNNTVLPQVAAPSQPTQPTTPGGTNEQTPQYKVVVPPSPSQATGTMAIMISTPNVAPQRALSLAKFAKRNIQSGGKWTGMQVFVFSDTNAARTFLKYQAQRKGAKLTPSEYQELANQGVWSSVPAYYETRGKTEIPYYPATNPRSWWGRS